MAVRADTIDLARLDLVAGSGARLDVEVAVGGLELGGQRYETDAALPVHIDVSRMVGGGYALRLRAVATLSGACMRCLEPAAPGIELDAREVQQDGGGDELTSPYVINGTLDVAAWARDALVLALPAQVVCRPDCAGLCPVCGENLNAAPEHRHEREPDPRWAKLRELRLD